MFKAKKHGTTPASGIQGYPDLDSSELQAWPKVPGHSLSLGAPPSPVPSIDSGMERGFWEKKYRLSIGISIVGVQAQSLGCVQPFVTLWTVAHQTPLSMTFSRQEYWSELLFPTPGDLPNPGTETESPVSSALADKFFTTVPPGKPRYQHCFPLNIFLKF